MNNAIRAQVEAIHQGEFVVVDIETGDYEIDSDDLVATKRALAKRPRGRFCMAYALERQSGTTVLAGASAMSQL